jgi:hypothetical protein
LDGLIASTLTPLRLQEKGTGVEVPWLIAPRGGAKSVQIVNNCLKGKMNKFGTFVSLNMMKHAKNQ